MIASSALSLSLSLMALAAIEFEEPGVLELRAKDTGVDVSSHCRWSAYSTLRPKELALDGSLLQAVRLAPGSYRIHVECSLRAGVLGTVLNGVKMRPGLKQRKELNLVYGAVVVHTKRDGGRVTADVEIVDASSGTILSKGLSGNRLIAPVGRHQVRVGLHNQGSIPCSVVQELAIAAKATKHLRLDLTDGSLKVQVTRNGRSATGLVVLENPHNHERIAEFATDYEELVPPGRYDVVVTLNSSYDFEGRRLRNVEVKPAQSMQQKVDFSMGTLLVRARISGVDVAARTYLYLPNALDYFNFANTGSDIDLSPGRYKISVLLDESVPYDAARPSSLGAERLVTIKPRVSNVVDVDFTPGAVVIDARKNGKPTQAALTLWISKPQVKLGHGPSGEPVSVAAGTYLVDVLYPNGRGGELMTLNKVVVHSGKTTVERVNIERGTLTIDTYDMGARVDAEVRFFKRSSKAPYAVVRGGEAAELPPGVYEIEIAHGQKTRQVSSMRVKPGTWEVRKVEF